MRNLLLIIMILGMLAGIGAAYFGINERQKALEIKDAAVTKESKAVDKQKTAESDRDKAIAEKIDAESKKKTAETDMERYKNISEQATKKAQSADDAKSEAVSKENQANKKHDEMKTKMENALVEAEQAKKERDEALGNEAGAEQIKEGAEKNLAQMTDDMGKIMDEFNKMKEVNENVAKLTGFIGKFTTILINDIQSGDDTFVEGLDLFLSAEIKIDKVKALKLISEAGKKYERAKGQIDKLESTGNVTENIIKTMTSSVTENITCIQETSKSLTALAQDPNPDTPAKKKERYSTYINIRRRKEKADSLMSDICGNILKLMEENKSNILPSQTAIINRAQDNFNKRWLSTPEGSEENTSANPPK
jgi:hypothetical protein